MGDRMQEGGLLRKALSRSPANGRAQHDPSWCPAVGSLSISGHRTVSMFLRYNITAGADQREAFRRVGTFLAEAPKQTRVATLP